MFQMCSKLIMALPVLAAAYLAFSGEATPAVPAHQVHLLNEAEIVMLLEAEAGSQEFALAETSDPYQ